MLFEQVFSLYAVSAQPVTLASDSECLSKPFSPVRLISQPPLSPSLVFVACGFQWQFFFASYPPLPDPTEYMYSLTDAQRDTTVFVALLPLCPLTDLGNQDPNL